MVEHLNSCTEFSQDLNYMQLTGAPRRNRFLTCFVRSVIAHQCMAIDREQQQVTPDVSNGTRRSSFSRRPRTAIGIFVAYSILCTNLEIHSLLLVLIYGLRIVMRTLKHITVFLFKFLPFSFVCYCYQSKKFFPYHYLLADALASIYLNWVDPMRVISLS